jgi:hypothetical protein
LLRISQFPGQTAIESPFLANQGQSLIEQHMYRPTEGKAMNLDSLRLIRNVLLRATLIGIVFTWILAGLTICMWDTWAGMASQMMHTPTTDFGPLISNWFAIIKFYVIFVLLVPALAVHWEIKKLEKGKV